VDATRTDDMQASLIAMTLHIITFFNTYLISKEIKQMEKAKAISPIGQAPMPIDEAIKIIGTKLPDSMPVLSREYGAQVWAFIENDELTKKNKKNLAKAYQSMAAHVCAGQIETVGRFDPTVDFSILSDVQVFPGTEKGVETCRACKGLGGLIKFNKKPKEVQCLKCKTLSFTMDGKAIIIDDKIITVDGVDMSSHRDYKWLFGHRIEECKTCGATGRYIKDDGNGLIINVVCTTCEGKRYTDEFPGTQVITRCKTCHGKQRLKIPMLIGSVKSITPCNVCGGMGFIKPPVGPDNPALPKDIASAITASL
jgi:hypothetical protein